MKSVLFSTLFLCFVYNAKSQSSPSVNTENGKFVVYYPSGNIKAQGKYQNNKREGEWFFYHENGNIALKKNFSNGSPIGEWIYYNTDGTLAMKVDDIAKVNEKVEIIRYENNKVKYKSAFIDGRKNTESQGELNKKF